MGGELTLAELAERIGEPPERVHRWTQRGLIGRPGGDGFGTEDVERARLIGFLSRRGIDLEVIAAYAERGEIDQYIRAFAAETAGPTLDLGAAAERLGVEPAAIVRLAEAVGLGHPDTLTEEDLTALEPLKAARAAGFPDGAIVELARVFSDAMRRVADAEARLFYFHIGRAVYATGLEGTALTEAVWRASDQLLPLAGPLLLYFHRRALFEATRHNAVLYLTQMGGTGAPGELDAAVMFVDLSSFTPLAEAMGNAKSAEILERFSCLVRDAASRFDGRVVKEIGDAFLLIFPEARSAVVCALEIERQSAEQPHFPAVRSGIHLGAVLHREGDYVGTTVNVAARLVAAAERHQILFTAVVRKELGALAGAEVAPVGRRRLKGLSEEVELWEARSSGTTGAVRLVDPICGMELGAAGVAARLTLDGREFAFCSEACLQRYIAASDRYGGA